MQFSHNYDSLVSEIINVHTNGNISSILVLLREFAVYCSPSFTENLNESICNILLTLSRISSNSNDYDRKISRLCIYILTEIINYNMNDYNISYIKNIQNKMFILIKEELEQNNLSYNRLFNLWKTFGIITCNIKNSNNNVPTNMANEVMKLAVNELKKLKVLPIRKKKILLGQKKADKDYENDNLLWISVLSCIRHTNISPPEDIINILLIAITSPNEILARHALYLLHVICCNTEFKASLAGSLLIKLRPQQGIDNVYINQQDDLCQYYLGNILSSLVLSDKLSELMIVDIYNEIKVFIIHSTPKSCSDLILNLFKNRYIWFHIYILENHKNGFKLIEEFCKILFKHLSMINIITNIVFLKLLQSCQCIGNFIWNSNFEVISSSKYKPTLNYTMIEWIIKLVNILNNLARNILNGNDNKISSSSSSYICKNIIISLLWLLPDELNHNHFNDFNWIDFKCMIHIFLNKIDNHDDISYDIIVQVFERLKYSEKYSININNTTNTSSKVCDLLVIENCLNIVKKIIISYCSLKHIKLLVEVWNYLIVTFIPYKIELYRHNIDIEVSNNLSKNIYIILLDSLIYILENSNEIIHDNYIFIISINSLRTEALWMIGEYGLIWFDMMDNNGDVLLISQVLPKIISELIFYSASNNIVAIKCLYKLFIRGQQFLENLNENNNNQEIINMILNCNKIMKNELHKCNCRHGIDYSIPYFDKPKCNETLLSTTSNSIMTKNNNMITPIKSINSESSLYNNNTPTALKMNKPKNIAPALNSLNISSADKALSTRSSNSKTLPSAKPAPITKKI